jgi:hypothetical protein
LRDRQVSSYSVPVRPNQSNLAEFTNMAKRPKVHRLEAHDYSLGGPESVHLSLRLLEGLRRRLEREAENHRISLSREIHLRLEDSFQRETSRTFEKLIADLEICWLRYSARFLRLELEEQLAADLAACKELPPQIATRARLWLAHRAQEQRPSSIGAAK